MHALDNEQMQPMPSSPTRKHQTVMLTHLQRDADERYSVSIKGCMSAPHQLFSKYVDTLNPDPSAEVFTACQQGAEDMVETNPTTGEIMPKSAFMCMKNTACVAHNPPQPLRGPGGGGPLWAGVVWDRKSRSRREWAILRKSSAEKCVWQYLELYDSNHQDSTVNICAGVFE